jgi:hypothetical protein
MARLEASSGEKGRRGAITRRLSLQSLLLQGDALSRPVLRLFFHPPGSAGFITVALGSGSCGRKAWFCRPFRTPWFTTPRANPRSAALLIIRGRFFRIRMIGRAFAIVRTLTIASAPQPSAASDPTPPSVVEAG